MEGDLQRGRKRVRRCIALAFSLPLSFSRSLLTSARCHSCSTRMNVTSGEIPAEFLEAAIAKRAELIETLAEVDDELAEAWLDEREITGQEISVSTMISLPALADMRCLLTQLLNQNRLLCVGRLSRSSSLPSSSVQLSPTSRFSRFLTVSVFIFQRRRNPKLSLSRSFHLQILLKL